MRDIKSAVWGLVTIVTKHSRCVCDSDGLQRCFNPKNRDMLSALNKCSTYCEHSFQQHLIQMNIHTDVLLITIELFCINIFYINIQRIKTNFITKHPILVLRSTL